MAKYLYIYHGGKSPDNPEEGAKVMQAWMAWFENMGEAVVDGGNPAGPSQTVTADGVVDGGGANPTSGYTLVNAADMAAATTMAKGCPIMADGGSVEVVECLDM